MIFLIRKKVVLALGVGLVGVCMLLAVFFIGKEPSAVMTMAEGEILITEEGEKAEGKEEIVGIGETTEESIYTGEMSEEEREIREEERIREEKIQEVETLKWNWQKERERKKEELKFLLADTEDEAIGKEIREEWLVLMKEEDWENECQQILASKNFYHVSVMAKEDRVTAVVADAQKEDGKIIAEVLERCCGVSKENIVVILK